MTDILRSFMLVSTKPTLTISKWKVHSQWLFFLLKFCLFFVLATCKNENRQFCKLVAAQQLYLLLLFRSLLRGEELYTQMVFFVQTILADRYIHRRELRLVSIESLPSVEYGIKKIFLILVFYRELSRFKLLRKKSEFSWFYSHFPEFLTKISLNLLKFVEVFKQVLLILFLKTKNIVVYFYLIFFVKNLSKYFKNQIFHQKHHEISFFSPLWLNLQETHRNTTNTIIIVDSKLGYFHFNFRCERSVIKTLPFFAKFTRWLSKRRIYFWFLTKKISISTKFEKIKCF